MEIAAADDANAAIKTSTEAPAAEAKSEVESGANVISVAASTAAVETLSDDVKAAREITPAPATDKKAEAALNKKSKGQMTLASFFGKNKFPATPAKGAKKQATKAPSSSTQSPQKHAKKPAKKPASKGKESKTAKNQKVKSESTKSTTPSSANTATPRTNASEPASGANSTSAKTSTHHNKMDFKDVIVGKLSKSSTVKSKAKSKDDSPTAASVGDDKLDSLLPHIPPVSSVQSQKGAFDKKKATDSVKSSAAAESSIKPALSQDESEASSVGMGALKSQLVHIFENPPAAGTKTNNRKEDDDEEKKEADETPKVGPSLASTETRQEAADLLLAESTKDGSPVAGLANESETPSGASETAEQGEGGEPLEKSDKSEERPGADPDTGNADKGGSEGQHESAENIESESADSSPTDPEEGSSEAAGAKEEKASRETGAEASPGGEAITVGSLFVKKFGQLGYFVGEVTALPTDDHAFYRVFYPKDGDREELSEKMLLRLMNTAASKKMRLERATAGPDTTSAANKQSNAENATTDISAFFSSKTKAGESATVAMKTGAAKPQEEPKVPLDAETQALLDKHQGMQAEHIEKAKRMVEQGRNDLDSSEVSVDMPSTENISISDAGSGFPDTAVPHLLALLEGR